jgi:MoxR-like ATPase
VRRVPDDLKVVGDKALFDLGLLGRRRVRGYDLEELGRRAYRVAGFILKLLAEDRRLRRFFEQNRLLMLPLEEEVVFLRQCSEKIRLYADILNHTPGLGARGEGARIDDVAARVPLMAAAAEALADAAVPSRGGDAPRGGAERYLEAARVEAGGESRLGRERMISAYERLLLFSALDLVGLEAALSSVVVDQPRAIEALCDEFSLFAAGTADLRKPPAYFLVGPTGVGKNHLVESLCRLLEGLWQIDIPLLTIEGPNYTYPSDINELRGATRGFIRSDEEGLLTSFHERSSRSPVAFILVDEVEKAHPHLLTFFLSILDRGTTTDNRGNELNFGNCMMFFTSNLGYSDAQQETAPIGYFDDEARHRASDRYVRRRLRHGLKPEFVNRVRMIHFDRLGRASAERILALELERIARRYREIHGIDLELDDTARDELIRRGFSPEFAARAALGRSRLRRGGGAAASARARARPSGLPCAASRVRRRRVRLRAGRRRERVGTVSGPAASCLLESVRGLLERTYRISSGLGDLAPFVIGDQGYRLLYAGGTRVDRAGAAAGGARTLVRETGAGVAACIYFPDELIRRLEAVPPQRGLRRENVEAFATFVEEIDHLLCIAERAERALPLTLFELELHAGVSKYLVLARFLAGRRARLDAGRRQWLRQRLFHAVRYADEDAVARERYRVAARWAVRLLDALAGRPPTERLDVLRRFHAAGFRGKLELIERLQA